MASFIPFTFDPTAFMSGQMESKLWLCEALYRTYQDTLKPGKSNDGATFRIHLLAGWYALTNVLLRARGQLPISHVLSIDSDPLATQGALILNEAFEFRGEFSAVTADINTDYEEIRRANPPPDIVINTAVEHITGRDWFDEHVNTGTMVVLQSNDMDHLDEHVHTVKSVDDLLAAFPLQEVYFTGAKHFDYFTWSFNRFMIIGVK